MKVRNNTQSVSYSSADTSTSVGNVVQINGINAPITNVGNLDDLVIAAELIVSGTGKTSLETGALLLADLDGLLGLHVPDGDHHGGLS